MIVRKNTFILLKSFEIHILFLNINHAFKFFSIFED